MKQNKFGQLIFSESDVCDLLMQGHDLASLKNLLVDDTVKIEHTPELVAVTEFTGTEQEFHQQQQKNWHMPIEYQHMDIAEHVLSLCNSQAELQRCGQELLLYQERNLFDLLRYLKYLVDVMQNNSVIWGIGRGSSVASYVLYKLGVHRIDSLYYDLDPEEFLR